MNDINCIFIIASVHNLIRRRAVSRSERCADSGLRLITIKMAIVVVVAAMMMMVYYFKGNAQRSKIKYSNTN